MTDNSKSSSKFPSQFVPQSEKVTKVWCMGNTKGLHEEAAHQVTATSLCRNNTNFPRQRRYGRGEQEENQYKELMGLKKDKGKLNTSFRNLSFKILKVAPKLRNSLINRIMGIDFKIQVKPVDNKSLNERRSQKNEMLAYVVSQEGIKKVEETSGATLEKPVLPGEIPPASIKDVEPWLDMHPKNSMAMEVTDYLKYSLGFNNWKQLSREIVGDLVDLGIAGTIQYLDSDGFIRVRRALIEQCVSNKCIYPDFRDLIRFGEYVQMTVSDLKRETKGSFGEEAYRQIAQNVAGEGTYGGSIDNLYNANTYTWAYDHEKITVLKAMWYSSDTTTYKEFKNGAGNTRVKEMNHGYVPFRGDMSVNSGKGYSDEEFNEKFKGKQQLYRNVVKNVYRCSWVVGTDYAYDFGLLPNMLKSVNSLGETQMPVTLISTDFMSPMGQIEQVLDQIQIDYLQWQSHRIASKPPGVAIEKQALAKLAMGKAGGKRWDPKEALIMFAEIGSLIYDGYDNNGQPLPYLPFKDLVNGMSPAAQEHWNFIIQGIDLARTLLGLNALTEGQTPPERMPNGVAQMGLDASNNALSHITAAYQSIFENTCKNMFQLFQANISAINGDALEEALGSESHKYFMLNSDIGLREMGIAIEEGPDQTLRDKISNLLQNAVGKGEMLAEDAILIEMEDNVWKALQMVKKARIDYENRMQNMEMQKADAATRAQGEEAQKLQDAKAKIDSDLLEKEKALEEFKAMVSQSVEADKFKRELFLERVRQGHDLEKIREEFQNDLVLVATEGQWKIKENAAKPAPKPSTSK